MRDPFFRVSISWRQLFGNYEAGDDSGCEPQSALNELASDQKPQREILEVEKAEDRHCWDGWQIS